MKPPTCLIDQFGPLPLVRPASVPELQDAVQHAASDGLALYPLGGQTMLGYGLPPARPGVGLDLCHLTQVIDYPARDMTITVQAGITLAKLQALLATQNQRLPIDVPLADRATLGGALATNMSGPRRYGFGTLRDYVIGITTINDEGHETKAGGRVVKNVAGYDLCKLHIGALGTLGILSQVTLKLKPLPEEQALITLRCQTDDHEPLLEQLHSTRTRPVCLDFLNRAAVESINPQLGDILPEAPWILVIGFEDNQEAVTWQVQQLRTELAQDGQLEARVGSAAEPLWHALVEFPLRDQSRLTFKANLLPRAVAAFCRQAAALHEGLLLQAHAGNGIVIGHADGDLTLEQAQAMLKTLHASAAAAQGNVVVFRCPTAWKAGLPIWGLPRGDSWLMRAVKEKLDPRRLFNPGRFVDAL